MIFQIIYRRILEAILFTEETPGVDFSRIFDSGADGNDDVIKMELLAQMVSHYQVH